MVAMVIYISSGIVLSNSATLTYHSHIADPGAGCSSDNIGIVGGVLGALVALLLVYSVVTTLVIVVVMLHIRRVKVSINQPVYAG